MFIFDPKNLIRRILHYFIPPENWNLLVVVLLGIFTGVLLVIFYISNATSYLSDDPKTCINCHVMYPQYASWAHSSHYRITNCNDCHVPHTSFAEKYFFKAMDGMRHASIFTLRMEPQVIQIKEAGIGVVQQNCKRCHGDLVEMVALTEVSGKNYKEGRGHRCWDCHREVPHGTVNSLGSYPFALVPSLEPVIPEWMSKQFKSEKTNSISFQK